MGQPVEAGVVGLDLLTALLTPAVLLGLALLVVRTTGRGPSVLWAAAPVFGILLVAALDLATADASAAGQVFFCFPVLYAAAQLRPPAAYAAMALAVAADAVVAVSLLPPLAAGTDVVYVGVTLVTMTVLLVRAGQRQDRLTAELRRQAAIDPLTGLVTRRVLDDAAECALSSSDVGTVLVLADVDHFKAINDTYGHPVGDAALVHLAEILAAHSRPQDVVSRLGGDEVALLLPGCSAWTGTVRAGRIVRAVRDTPLLTEFGTIPMSISAGVAHAPRDAGDLRSLYAAADSTLYEAKRAGRGRVGTPTAELTGARLGADVRYE